MGENVEPIYNPFASRNFELQGKRLQCGIFKCLTIKKNYILFFLCLSFTVVASTLKLYTVQ